MHTTSRQLRADNAVKNSDRRLPKSILFVAGNPDSRFRVTEWMSDAGFDCFAAADATEALLFADSSCMDMIIIDADLAGEDGSYLVEILHHNCPAAPILIYSAERSDEAVLSAMLKHGAASCIQGGTREVLLKAIEAVG